MTTLCDLPEEDGFERRDYALEAWDASAVPPGVFCYWKTTVPDPESKQRVFVDDQVLLDLFEGLAEDDRRTRVAYRFILGLILMRKKLMRYVGRTGRGEQERWQLRPRGADPDHPPVEMVNPHLDDDDVRELTGQLSEVLRGEL